MRHDGCAGRFDIAQRSFSAGAVLHRGEPRNDDDHADRTWALFLAINAAAGMDGARWRPMAGQIGAATQSQLDKDWIPA